ncbi:MAG TPA: hypothetical protein VMY37_01165 [Thermoguttaceae bacterium]|nr:hypothetical protein [Thermoguttaceae bacterium]
MNRRTSVSRRTALQWAGAWAASAALPRLAIAKEEPASPAPVRQITRGPKYHWFGYYDKLEFDPTARYVLGMEVDFEHRSPRPDDVIKVGMVDLAENDRWIELGRSTAWCWQQGCMLQWRPRADGEVLWNDRQGDRYVCHLLDVKTRAKRTIPYPVYAVSPDGRWAISTDFRRLGDMRPGYGYNGIADPYGDEPAPAESGIWRVDLETGRRELIFSLADAAKIPFEYADFGAAKHWFNHLLVNTDGTRIEFLHRWKEGQGRHLTRMFTAAPDGSDVRVAIGSGAVSHFIWRDPTHVLAFSKPTPDDPWGFHLHEDKPGGTVERIGEGVMYDGDGHCTYSPDLRWILCDTYPDRERKRKVYMYHIAENRRVDLGSFYEAPEYWSEPRFREWRCDLHPRFCPDGRHVVIDSPHAGGRQLHLIDVSAVVG